MIDEEDKQERLFMFMDDMKEDDKAIVFVGRRSSLVYLLIGRFKVWFIWWLIVFIEDLNFV